MLVGLRLAGGVRSQDSLLVAAQRNLQRGCDAVRHLIFNRKKIRHGSGDLRSRKILSTLGIGQAVGRAHQVSRLLQRYRESQTDAEFFFRIGESCNFLVFEGASWDYFEVMVGA